MARNELLSQHSQRSCQHSKLTVNTTPHAAVAKYRRPTTPQRAAAVTPLGRMKAHPSGKKTEEENIDPAAFPAPLLLPGDDLSLDPRQPPQSLRAWLREKNRNEVTPSRRTVYLAAPPEVEPDAGFIEKWTRVREGNTEPNVGRPRVLDILSYLSAFYSGLPVNLLPPPALRFTRWDDVSQLTAKAKAKGKGKGKTTASSTAPSHIGLCTSTECISIRTRRSPRAAAQFPQQLNLDDLLDAAISVLPSDAYALLLLVEHDLFEAKDDEFVCGRAYGGSRVAVVSTARYNPAVDWEQGVEREHAWPASHCEEYLRSSLSDVTDEPLPKRGRKNSVMKCIVSNPQGSSDGPTRDLIPSPLEAAVSAHLSLPSFSSPAALAGLWLGRVCKTASHELGHCFGIDHCVYYACAMQGSASLAEDARQPPYLCPVDEAKLARATGVGDEERRGKMIEFCEETGNTETHLFRAFAAWMRGK